jgi:hypothetical protein
MQNSVWKIGIVAVMLAVFAGIGVAHVVNPDPFIRRSGVLKGGELLTRSNRFQFRIVGALFAAFAIYLLYQLLR